MRDLTDLVEVPELVVMLRLPLAMGEDTVIVMDTSMNNRRGTETGTENKREKGRCREGRIWSLLRRRVHRHRHHWRITASTINQGLVACTCISFHITGLRGTLGTRTARIMSPLGDEMHLTGEKRTLRTPETDAMSKRGEEGLFLLLTSVVHQSSCGWSQWLAMVTGLRVIMPILQP
jgi:hypothetical protein